MKYELYPWQKECLSCWSDNQYHGIVNVITGGGKTVLALSAIELLERKLRPSKQSCPLRIKIVVPTASLMAQWKSAILDYFGSLVSPEDIGCRSGGRKDSAEHKFMIYVINSARYSLARHVIADLDAGNTVLLIADECHHYSSTENQKIFEFLPFLENRTARYASLGLSATPETDNPDYAAVLKPALGNEIYHYGFEDATKKKSICQSAIFQIALSFTADEKAEYEDLTERLNRTLNYLRIRFPLLGSSGGGNFFSAVKRLAGENGTAAVYAQIVLALSYRRKALISCAGSRVSCAVELVCRLDKNSKIIIFGERIDQADALYKKLEWLFPNQSARYHSAIDPHARKLALKRFENGEIRILISCRALDEGFDVPSANVGIILSSASVKRQRIQRLGRILRRYEGKEIACLYYLYIDGTVEQPSYFSEIPAETALCDLTYDATENEFSHPAYETAANRLLRKFRKKHLDKLLLAEAEKSFRRGIVRPDWLTGKIYCKKKIAESKNNAERNYWICMRQMK